MATPPNPQEYYFIFTADSILRIPRLPTEVLLLILAYVPPEDLCHVALASREWYDLAYDAGLEIRLSTRSADSDRLTYLRDIVFHALQHDRSPRIALHLNYRPRGEERTTGDMSLEDAGQGRTPRCNPSPRSGSLCPRRSASPERDARRSVARTAGRSY